MRINHFSVVMIDDCMMVVRRLDRPWPKYTMVK